MHDTCQLPHNADDEEEASVNLNDKFVIDGGVGGASAHDAGVAIARRFRQ